MSIVIKLGKRLKMVRIAAGIKQKELSKTFDIPASLLSMYENGTREPSLAFLERFSKKFKMPLSQLFVLMDDDSDNNNNNNDESVFLLNKLKKHMVNLEKELLKTSQNAN